MSNQLLTEDKDYTVDSRGRVRLKVEVPTSRSPLITKNRCGKVTKVELVLSGPHGTPSGGTIEEESGNQAEKPSLFARIFMREID